MTSSKCLLVMDVQSAMFELPRPLHTAQDFLHKLAGLIERARTSKNPVVYVQYAGGDGSPFCAAARGTRDREDTL